MLPPAAFVDCPTPAVRECPADQACIAGNLLAVAEAWSTCRSNADLLKQWMLKEETPEQ